MVDYPSIGIMISYRNKRKINLNLYQHHHNLPIKLYTFTPADIIWEKHKIVGLYMVEGKCKEKKLPFPDVVYNRCYYKKTISTQRLTNTIGPDKCFNSINWFDKWEVHKLLIQSNLKEYIPDTFLFKKAIVPELLKDFNLLYIKPNYGHRGKNVYRLEQKNNGDIHISLHSLAPRVICRKNEDIHQKLWEILGSKSFIVQKGIESSKIYHQYYDIRVLVQKDILGKWAVSTIVCRVAHELFFNTSVYDSIYDVDEIPEGVFPNKKILLQSIKNISINAARVLETHMGLLGELSVDFILDKEMKLWIIEINGKPEKSVYNDIKNFKCKHQIYVRPIEYAYYLATH